jgi:hypothetical protein
VISGRGCSRSSVARSSMIEQNPHARGLFKTWWFDEYWPKWKLRDLFRFFPIHFEVLRENVVSLGLSDSFLSSIRRQSSFISA